MANWRHYMNSDYAGCRLLAYAHDHCRDRDVRIFLIPGEWEAVGISDGTDVWIAPVSAQLFSVNVQRLLEDIKAGKAIPKAVALSEQPRRPRVALIKENAPEASPRKRVVLETPIERKPRRALQS